MNGAPIFFTGEYGFEKRELNWFFPRSPKARDRGHPLFFRERLSEKREGELVLSHSSSKERSMNGAPIFFTGD